MTDIVHEAAAKVAAGMRSLALAFSTATSHGPEMIERAIASCEQFAKHLEDSIEEALGFKDHDDTTPPVVANPETDTLAEGVEDMTGHLLGVPDTEAPAAPVPAV